jgi:hypothetical protein
MTVNQIYDVLNVANTEMFGQKAITVKDTSTFVSFGDKVLSTDNNKEMFYNIISDIVGRTDSAYRELTNETNSDIMVNKLEYGAVLRKITIGKIAKNKTNDSWVTGSQPLTSHEDKTDIKQYLFSARGTWELETKVIYDMQLASAFENESAMAAFINLIFIDIHNGIEVDKRNCCNLTVNTAIANAYTHSSTLKTAINMIEEYNKQFPAAKVTASNCIYNKDWLRYVSKIMNDTLKEMREVSELYNTEGGDRWTPDSELNIRMLAYFADSAKFYLDSDTFNKDLVALPRYKEVNFWQGLGEKATPEEKMTVCVENGSTQAYINGVIAFMFDKLALGVMVDNVRIKSVYLPSVEHTEYFP